MQKAFWSSFESKIWGFVVGIESGRRKIINHDFVQHSPTFLNTLIAPDPGKPRRELQIFDTRVDFLVPVQSRGRFL